MRASGGVRLNAILSVLVVLGVIFAVYILVIGFYVIGILVIVAALAAGAAGYVRSRFASDRAKPADAETGKSQKKGEKTDL
jgi:uncharacterized membrane protein